MPLTEADREFRRRHFTAPYGFGVRKQQHEARMVIPDDVTWHQRDPSPCFRCGTSGSCKHRPWEGDHV